MDKQILNLNKFNYDEKKMNSIFKKKIEIYYNKYYHILKVVIKNKKIYFDDNGLSSRWTNNVKYYFNKILPYINFNIKIFILMNDHITCDKYVKNEYEYNKFNKNYLLLNKYPFFSFVKPKNSNFLLIPDAFFMLNYERKNRMKIKGNFISFLNNLNDKFKFETKKNTLLFKTNNTKYNKIKEVLSKKKIKNIEICTDNKFYDINKQYKYKHFLGLFLRWDTSFYQLLSNSLVFIIDKIHKNSKETCHFSYINFLHLYLKDNIDYIQIILDEINEKTFNIKLETIKSITNSSTQKITEMTYKKVQSDFIKLIFNINKYKNKVK